MNDRYSAHKYMISLLLIVFTVFNSCYLWENRYVNGDHSCYESYQIGNTSQQNVTLHFFEKGKPKIVYAEVYNQTSLIPVDKEKAEIEATNVLTGDKLILASGETALLYETAQAYETGHLKVTSLTTIGSYITGTSIRFIGDSVIVSVDDETETVFPVRNAELWETWYDEKNFIYYHFWRIE